MSTNGGTAQYAVKKRRRPQAKKDKDEENAGKSNPSKRHRDRLNSELDNLAKLIPFSEDVLNKLDKLSILRLAVVYLRNKAYFNSEPRSAIEMEMNELLPKNIHQEVACFTESESALSLMALHGFIIVVTQDFNIFYITDSVQDYLGFPQSDVMNQSMLDLIHAEDREIFMKHMQINCSQTPQKPPEDGEPPTVPEYAKYGFTPEYFRDLSDDGLLHRSFICRLRCLLDNSSGFLALHFTGHLRLIQGQNRKGEGNMSLPPEAALFLLASPLQSPSILEIRTKNLIFRTKHKLDYKPLGIDAKGKAVLGYTEPQLRQRSGYEFIHSADMMHCADAHTKLMRKGESGLTIFRLLHKENNWVWVTASARLVFKGGRPDYIIATQRPIPEQEGEDQMKKRNHAFRFDFTGQAILYGKVNPIGTGNPSETNGYEEAPSAKRPCVGNGVESKPQAIDRLTLYGAQSMQSMDLYVGSIPNQPEDMYAKAAISHNAKKEFMQTKQNNLQQQFENEINQTSKAEPYFYPIGQQDAAHKEMQHTGSVETYSPMSAYSNTSDFHSSQSNMSTMPISSPGSSVYSDVEPPRLHHPGHENNYFDNLQFGQGFRGNPEYQSNKLKRAYPDENKAKMNPKQTGGGVFYGNTSVGKQIPKAENIVPNPFPSYQQNSGNIVDGRLQFPQQNNVQQLPKNMNAHLQIRKNPASHHIEDIPAQRLKQVKGNHNPTITDAMTIHSVVRDVSGSWDADNMANRMPENNFRMGDNMFPPQQNWPSNSEHVAIQDNVVQFDLAKIATEYQTTDPLSQVENYIKNHPSHAMAIATGQMPNNNISQVEFNSNNQFQQNPNHAPQINELDLDLDLDTGIPNIEMAMNTQPQYFNQSNYNQ